MANRGRCGCGHRPPESDGSERLAQRYGVVPVLQLPAAALVRCPRSKPSLKIALVATGATQAALLLATEAMYLFMCKASRPGCTPYEKPVPKVSAIAP